jgi:bifunctional damage-control phosphatase, subfamily II, fusion protein
MAALKRWENADALRDLPAVLASMDRLPLPERQEALIRGLLAGNMFDWGAHAVVSKLETGTLTFEAAGATVQRAAALDDAAALFARLDRPPLHRRAIVFVDNAGYDIALGVFPFVRFLLQRGTEVVLAANSLPALNDITYRELLGLVDAVAQNDRVFQHAVESRYSGAPRMSV